MAYDEQLVERIKNIFEQRHLNFLSKKMMGGRVFMLEDKMCCGTHIDKKYGDSLLMARIGEPAYVEEIDKNVCLPMDFTGRPMKGYIFVTPEGFRAEEDLEHWINLCVLFNPLAKVSKKRKK